MVNHHCTGLIYAFTCIVLHNFVCKCISVCTSGNPLAHFQNPLWPCILVCLPDTSVVFLPLSSLQCSENGMQIEFFPCRAAQMPSGFQAKRGEI